MTIIIMLVVLVGMTWFMQRQQKKQAKTRQDQLKGVQKGDEIVTIGGLFGTVDEVDTDAEKMILDVDGVYLTFELAALKRVVTKAEEDDAVVSEIETVEEAVVVSDDVTDDAEQAIDSAIESKD